MVILQMTTKSRGWCWTINNPTLDDEWQVEALKLSTTYTVYGKETGESGTFHWQGFSRFQHPITMSRAKQLLSRAHWEPQRGTIQQAADYCKKDGDFIEHGELPKTAAQTRREMWKNVIDWSESGELERIRDEFPHVYFLHFKRIQQLRERRMGIMPGALSNEWWFGPTGSGKSRRLWELYPDHFPKSLNKWWDGYADEPVVAMEEMDPDHGQYLGHFVKIWADRYPFSPETKGGHLKKIRPTKVIILSNYSIDDCFPREQDREPIKRRFKTVYFPTPIFPEPAQDEYDEHTAIESLLNLSQ